MTGDPIPPQDHVARYVGASGRDPDSGELQASAFLPRRTDGNSLSVNWLEFFGPRWHDCLDQVRTVLAGKLSRVGSSAVLAVLKVGNTLERVLAELPDEGRLLTVVHDPEDRVTHGHDDPSHAAIVGYTTDDEVVAELILDCVIATPPARLAPSVPRAT